MDHEQFRKWGKEMVDYVADYWQNIRSRRPLPDVKPHFLRTLMPSSAPEYPEKWPKIFEDLETCVMKGTTNWVHPHFFAYYPAHINYAAILGDILSDGINAIGFTWSSCPASTELEMVVLDWIAKILDLPEYFLNSHPGNGMGMIQTSASESTLVALLAARHRILNLENCLSNNNHFVHSFSSSTFKYDYKLLSRLVAYTSDQAHSSVEKAALIGAVQMRKVSTKSENIYGMTGEDLEDAIMADIERNLVPFFVCATLGTTSTCAFDDLPSIGAVCRKYSIYLHVDAAYAGGCFICPEYRHFLKGIEYVDSYNFNATKCLMVNMDCSLVWFKNAKFVENAFIVDPEYLKHKHQGDIIDFRNMQIPLGRRFRALKLWFVLRSMGVTGLQHNIRQMCTLALQFQELLVKDSRFELTIPATLGLVCFRLKADNDSNKKLVNSINDGHRIHLVGANLKGHFVLRFSISSQLTTEDDVKFAWLNEMVTVEQLDLQVILYRIWRERIHG